MLMDKDDLKVVKINENINFQVEEVLKDFEKYKDELEDVLFVGVLKDGNILLKSNCDNQTLCYLSICLNCLVQERLKV